MKPIKVWLTRAYEHDKSVNYNLREFMISFKKPKGDATIGGVPIEDRFFPCNRLNKNISRLFGKLPKLDKPIEGTLQFKRNK